MAPPDIHARTVSLPRRSFGTPVGWAWVIVLALVALAGVLVVAGVHPEWVGRATAVLLGLVLLTIVLLVTIVLAVMHRMRPVASNDDWVYW